MFRGILKNVETKKPLVHCITNYVTVNDCANIVLACGGSPIMADELAEIEEITSISDSLVINIGTLNDRLIETMIMAGRTANLLGRPVILDPVGAGASMLRTETVFRLLDEVSFSVIRGNISEIKTIYGGSGGTKGVDAAADDRITDENIEAIVQLAKKLSERTGAVIAMTGAMDVVANHNRASVIRNGHEMMSRITGSGCMLSSVIGAYCGANEQAIFESTVAAVGALGVSGERAFEKTKSAEGGTSTFRMYLIDCMSKMNNLMLSEGINIESK